MASSIDPTSSPRSSQEIPNASSPFSYGDDAFATSSLLAYPITSPVTPGRSSRKPSIETQPPRSSAASDHGGSGNVSDASPISRGKKPAWNVPLNSAIEAGLVMDFISWPALSESTRASPKSSSSDSLKALPDGSLSALPDSLVSSPSSKQASNNQNLNSSQNSPSSRDKTMKCGTATGGGSSISGASNGGLGIPSTLSVSTEASQSVPTKQPSLGNSPRGLPNQNNSNNDNDRGNISKAGGFSPQSHGGNGHQRGYGGGRRGINDHYSNYGNRRDGERGGYEWNHRNFGRDRHMQQLHQQRGVQPYIRPSSVAAARFIAPPPPLGPFSNHMGFPDFQSPIYYVAAPTHSESLRSVPFAPHLASAPQVMLFPAADPQRAMLLKQIEYYFSQENLCKDLYLRQNMEEEGWVPISLIAVFNRVKQLTNNIQYIVDTAQLSNVVEVQGDKIRKRDDWMTWVLRPANNFASASGLPSPTTNFDGLAAHLDNVYSDNTGLSGSAKNELALARSASVKLNSQMSLRNYEDGDAQVGTYSDRIWNMRTLVRSDTM